MVVERFKTPGGADVFKRAKAQGRLLPPGLHYVSSWVDDRKETCFQLMQTDRPELIEVWTARWNDLVDFEVFPVEDSEIT